MLSRLAQTPSRWAMTAPTPAARCRVGLAVRGPWTRRPLPTPVSHHGVLHTADTVQYVLGSKGPGQYMPGLVPFNFKDRSVAANALRKFTPEVGLGIHNARF